MKIRLLILTLVAILGLPRLAPAEVERREVARLPFTNSSVALDAVFLRHHRAVSLRLDDYTKHDEERRWHEIRMAPDQWEKFKSSYLQAMKQLPGGGGKVAVLTDLDSADGTSLTISIDPKLKALVLTLYRPDPYTHGAGKGVRRVPIALSAPAAQQVADHFPKADQLLQAGPQPLGPAPTGPWKLKEIQLVNGSDGPGQFKVVRSDARGGAAQVGQWKLGWSFDKDVTTLQPGQKITVSLLNQGPAAYGPNFPTMMFCLVGSTMSSPLGDSKPEYQRPDPEPFLGFQYTPKDPNPAVQHYWHRTNQSKTLYPGKDEIYNDTKDGTKGTMVVHVNPSGDDYAMFFVSMRTTQPFGEVQVCYRFERS